MLFRRALPALRRRAYSLSAPALVRAAGMLAPDALALDAAGDAPGVSEPAQSGPGQPLPEALLATTSAPSPGPSPPRALTETHATPRARTQPVSDLFEPQNTPDYGVVPAPVVFIDSVARTPRDSLLHYLARDPAKADELLGDFIDKGVYIEPDVAFTRRGLALVAGEKTALSPSSSSPRPTAHALSWLGLTPRAIVYKHANRTDAVSELFSAALPAVPPAALEAVCAAASERGYFPAVARFVPLHADLRGLFDAAVRGSAHLAPVPRLALLRRVTRCMSTIIVECAALHSAETAVGVLAHVHARTLRVRAARGLSAPQLRVRKAAYCDLLITLARHSNYALFSQVYEMMGCDGVRLIHAEKRDRSLSRPSKTGDRLFLPRSAKPGDEDYPPQEVFNAIRYDTFRSGLEEGSFVEAQPGGLATDAFSDPPTPPTLGHLLTSTSPVPNLEKACEMIRASPENTQACMQLLRDAIAAGHSRWRISYLASALMQVHADAGEPEPCIALFTAVYATEGLPPTLAELLGSVHPPPLSAGLTPVPRLVPSTHTVAIVLRAIRTSGATSLSRLGTGLAGDVRRAIAANTTVQDAQVSYLLVAVFQILGESELPPATILTYLVDFIALRVAPVLPLWTVVLSAWARKASEPHLDAFLDFLEDDRPLTHDTLASHFAPGSDAAACMHRLVPHADLFVARRPYFPDARAAVVLYSSLVTSLLARGENSAALRLFNRLDRTLLDRFNCGIEDLMHDDDALMYIIQKLHQVVQ